MDLVLTMPLLPFKSARLASERVEPPGILWMAVYEPDLIIPVCFLPAGMALLILALPPYVDNFSSMTGSSSMSISRLFFIQFEAECCILMAPPRPSCGLLLFLSF